MRCPREGCKGRLKVTHSYTEGSVRFSDRFCSVCGHRKVTQTVIMEGVESAYKAAKAAKEKGDAEEPAHAASDE